MKIEDNEVTFDDGSVYFLNEDSVKGLKGYIKLLITAEAIAEMAKKM